MVQYHRPETLSEALGALERAGDNGRVLVGGTDLLVGVRRQPLSPLVLVDVKRATDLPPAIEIGDNAVRVGPTATMSALAANKQIQRWFPALVAAANVVGSIAIRNRATLIGNICNASPACDTAPALLVYGAQVTIKNIVEERQVPIEDFFVGPGRTQCQSGEIVSAIEIPRPANGHCSAFQRLTRRRGVDLATVSAAAGLSENGLATIALGAVAPTPVKAVAATTIDVNDPIAVRQLAEELTEIASPISDVRATEEYRRAMTTVLTERAIAAAAGTNPKGAGTHG